MVTIGNHFNQRNGENGRRYVFILRVVFTFLQTRSKQNYLQMINDINTTRLPPGTLRSFSTVKRGCHEATEQLGEHHS